MLYLLVDCDNVLNGTLRNIIDRNINVKSITSIEIAPTLLLAEKVKCENNVKVSAGTPLKESFFEKEIDLLESKDNEGNSRGTVDSGEESHPKEPLYYPDLIIYQTKSINMYTINAVKRLRKS